MAEAKRNILLAVLALVFWLFFTWLGNGSSFSHDGYRLPFGWNEPTVPVPFATSGLNLPAGSKTECTIAINTYGFPFLVHEANPNDPSGCTDPDGENHLATVLDTVIQFLAAVGLAGLITWITNRTLKVSHGK